MDEATADRSPLPPGGVRIAFGLAMLLAPVLVSTINGFLASRPGTPAGAAAASYALVVITCFVAWRCAATSSRRLLGVALVLLVLQALVMLAVVPPGPWPAHRMLRVVSLLLTVATLVTAGLVFARIARPALAMTIVAATGGLLTFAEAVSGRLLHDPSPELDLAFEADSLARWRTLRDTTIREYAAENPDGYLDAVDVRDSIWRLDAQPGNEATLELPPDRLSEIRVAIARADTGPAWHIHLQQSRIPVEPQQQYTLRFRYRAEAPRTIGIGYTQGHPPWEAIGFYRVFEATTAWQDFVQTFSVDAADDNTQISFHLAGSAADVVIADVSLSDGLGLPVEPPLAPERYFVSYQFNRMGCRDVDYDSTAAARRILVLGGSGTMGRDVHQRHTLADQLEHPDSALRAAVPGIGDGIGEVINCATRGGDVEVMAQRLPALLEAYRPTEVLVALAVDDLRRVQHHQRLEWLRTAPAACRILTLCARVLMPGPGESPEVLAATGATVAAMRDRARAHGARLRVALIETERDPGWPALAAALRAALDGDGTAVMPLAPALVDSLPTEVLYVMEHPLPNALAHRLAAAHLSRLLAPTASP